ncbi:MAG: hypothetical protein AAGG50_12825 [Bacteroidota bacterium]
MPVRALLYVGLAYGLVVLLLWRVNRRREDRHLQGWAALLAVIVYGEALLLLHRFETSALGREARDAIEGLRRLLEEGGAALGPTIEAGHVLFGWLVLAVFLIAKVVLMGVHRALQALATRRRNKAAERTGQPPEPQTPSLAYEREPPTPIALLAGEPGRVVLMSRWVYPRFVAQVGAAVAAVLLLVAMADVTVADVPGVVPGLLALPLLVLLETAWYLGGPTASEADDEAEADEARAPVDLEVLWQQYQAIWPERVLAASAAVEVPPPPPPGPSSPLSDEAAMVWGILTAQHPALSAAHRETFGALWARRDVLVNDSAAYDLAPVLFAALQRDLLAGRRVLVLAAPDALDAPVGTTSPVLAWVEAWLHRLYGEGLGWTVAPLDAVRREAQPPHVIVADPAALLAPDLLAAPWFDALATVVLFDAAHLLSPDLMTTSALLHVLKDRAAVHDRTLQTIALADERGAELEASLRRALPFSPEERTVPRPAPPEALALVWRLDGPPVQRALLSTPTFLGTEPVLALPAWAVGADAIRLVEQEGVPVAEEITELDRHLGGVLPGGPLPADALQGTATARLDWLATAADTRLPAERPVVLARDVDHNPPATLRRTLALGTDAALVHVVSPPALLRDYLASHLGYFLRAPLPALTPRPTERTGLVVAYALLERLIAGPQSEAAVAQALNQAHVPPGPTEDRLTLLLREALGLDLAALGVLDVELRDAFDTATEQFAETAFFRLAPRLRDHQALAWRRSYDLIAGTTRLGHIPSDQLFQRMLPGQVRVFGGKPYQVDAIDEAAQVVRLHHRAGTDRATYRPQLRINVGPLRVLRDADDTRALGLGWTARATLAEATATVATPGYYAFRDGIDLSPAAFSFTALTGPNRVPDRVYSDARVLRLTFAPDPNVSGADSTRPDDPQRLAFTLATLLNEAFPTLFPETHGFIHAGATHDLAHPLADLMPGFTLADGPKTGKANEHAISITVLEDAHADLGLVQALFDTWPQVFALLGDVTAWLFEDAAVTDERWTVPDADPLAFLRYGQPDVPDVLDVEGIASFLHALLPVSQNERTQSRRRFYDLS